MMKSIIVGNDPITEAADAIPQSTPISPVIYVAIPKGTVAISDVETITNGIVNSFHELINSVKATTIKAGFVLASRFL
jgi:hypothetical protein